MQVWDGMWVRNSGKITTNLSPVPSPKGGDTFETIRWVLFINCEVQTVYLSALQGFPPLSQVFNVHYNTGLHAALI